MTSMTKTIMKNIRMKSNMPQTRKKPQRQCVGCGQNKDKTDLIRVLRNDASEIFLDETGKKNGRGAYICKTKECLERAIKTKGLERSLKTAIPAEVYERLKEEMNKINA